MNETTIKLLNDLESELSSTVGPDLAESLIKASRHSGGLTLDIQLAINDGLEILTDENRREVLGILDRFAKLYKDRMAAEALDKETA